MKVLLDSKTIGLVVNSEFTEKQRFKLKKIERPIYVRNIDSSFNKEELLQTQVLRAKQANKPCIRLTQENSIESSVQDCLSYILDYHGPYYYFFSLP